MSEIPMILVALNL